MSEEASVRAKWLNEKGILAMDRGDTEAAESAYREAIAVDPPLSWAWFNLGLVHKHRRDWDQMLECNRRAGELSREEEDPAWWNLWIAATALRRWDVARDAWARYGIAIREGTGPVEVPFRPALVRLNPEESGGNMEVVWCRRIGPARGIIESIPFPSSRHHHGDIVLHDGVPNGERVLEDATYNVFDELERWEASDKPTLSVSIWPREERDLKSLVGTLEARELPAEDWTSNVRSLCKACSEGSVEQHVQPTPRGWEEWREVGMAGNLFDARHVLDEWITAVPENRAYENLRLSF